MTGLNISRDQIIEIAVIVTDAELSKFIEGPNLIIHTSDELLDSMDDWCKDHHGQSGLTAAVRESSVSLEQAQDVVLDFLTRVCGLSPRSSFLVSYTAWWLFYRAQAGNSVHEDRTFIRFQMPSLYQFLHYRIVDVSSIKIVAATWNPSLPFFKKRETHRALVSVLSKSSISPSPLFQLDIRESIGELMHYRKHAFK